jgi:beta-glucosidase
MQTSLLARFGSALLLFLLVFQLLGVEAAPAASGVPLYLQPSQPLEARVDNLLSLMTIEEKVGQMALVERQSLAATSDIATYHLGGLLSGSGSKPATNTAEMWASMIGDYQAVAAASRLPIPLLYGSDAIHGQGHVAGLTVFPHAIGLGATRDVALTEAIAKATAYELALTGVNWNYAPNLDIPRDIRWGRVYETYGDDRDTVARLGAATVAGLQAGLTGDRSVPRILATPKHFIGLGAMGFRTSTNKNFLIDQGRTEIDYVALRNEYLPPFEAAIDAGALSIMAGLNGWGRTKIAGSKYLLTTVLKEQLGFSGFVVSDWYGVYELPGSKYRATVTAINAGIDMVMLPFEYQEFTADVLRANRVGLISDKRIDDAVRRILRAKFALGLFDAPRPTPVLGEDRLYTHRALARQAVAQSAVLLKNDHAVLPLRLHELGTTSILIAGSAADNTGHQAGAWTLEWQGVHGNNVPGATSVLAGLREQLLAASTTLTYAATPADLAAAPKASIGIAVVGEAPYAEGWGDTAYPVLSAADRATITALRPKVERLIVVLVSGRPLLITHELSQIDALVAAWLPGSEGAGVADVLLGAQPFTGTLPLAWPLRSEQLPLSSTGTTADGSALLYATHAGLTTTVGPLPVE